MGGVAAGAGRAGVVTTVLVPGAGEAYEHVRHGLETGDAVTFRGHGLPPALDGAFAVTRIDPFRFEVAIRRAHVCGEVTFGPWG